MVAESKRAAARWRDGDVIDASQHMMDLTLAIVSRTLFSTDLGPEISELTESINRIMGLYHYLVLLPAVEILVHLREARNVYSSILSHFQSEYRTASAASGIEWSDNCQYLFNVFFKALPYSARYARGSVRVPYSARYARGSVRVPYPRATLAVL